MSNWETATNSSTVTRDEAKRRILALAEEQGIEGAFKVFHNGNLVATPDDLPDQVNMDEIRVSEVLDQATGLFAVEEAPQPIWFEWRGMLHAVTV